MIKMVQPRWPYTNKGVPPRHYAWGRPFIYGSRESLRFLALFNLLRELVQIGPAFHQMLQFTLRFLLSLHQLLKPGRAAGGLHLGLNRNELALGILDEPVNLLKLPLFL